MAKLSDTRDQREGDTVHIKAATLDDLMRDALEEILKFGTSITSSKGTSKEITGVLFELTDPRARLSRTESKGTIFSCIGELLWYLSGSNELDFIKYYIKDYEKSSDDGRTAQGAYGPRIFGKRGEFSQYEVVAKLLRERPTSRQIVVQIFNAEDIAIATKDVPCTCTLQFFVREQRLNLISYMRSNDIFKGFPHDIFAFTMFQELLSRELGLDLGWYKHFVGSLHLYDENTVSARTFLSEGWLENKPMSAMPAGDQSRVICEILEYERKIRKNIEIDIESVSIDEYWKDILRLLLLFRQFRNEEKSGLDYAIRLSGKISNVLYKPYADKLLRRIENFNGK